MSHNQVVKIIGGNGQISLGKEFAGKMVLIDQVDVGTWIIKSGEFIPDSEKWLHSGNNMQKLEQALTWTEKNKPKDNFDQIIKSIENDKNRS
jgi:hypothetical protein